MARRSNNRKSGSKNLDFPLTGLVFQMLIVLIFLGYVLYLEEDGVCPCASNKEHRFLKYWLTFVLALLITYFLLDRFNVRLPSIVQSLLLLVLVVGNLYYLYCVLKFSSDMRDSECSCTDTIIRSVMEVFALFSVLQLVLALLIAVFSSVRK